MILGTWFEKEGYRAEAVQEYQRALECDSSLIALVSGGEKRPLAAHVQLLLGKSAEEQGNTDEAIAHYRQALGLDSALVEAYNNLGNLLDARGKPDEALASYESAARLRPDAPLVRENLGSQLLKLGRFDEAMQEYQQAARLAPGDPRPFYLMGKAWLRQGQSAKAVAEFENALSHDGNDVQSLVFLARVLAADEDSHVRNGTRAIELAQKANSLTEGKQPFILGSLAMAYAEGGRFDDARQTARQAVALTATNTETFSNLQEQLKTYELNQPYRESSGPSSK
jgi:tetratricopeptide (TPR) repeat protein